METDTVSKEKVALDVGCGERKIEIEGYTVKRVDIRPDVNPDIISNGLKIPLDEESVDMIFSSHFLEHIGRLELYELFKHWRKLLKARGKLYIIVPDLEVAAIELLSGQTHPATWDILYGAQNYLENFHKSGFTKNSLIAFLEKYGFEVETIKCENREIVCEAIKSEVEFDD